MLGTLHKDSRRVHSLVGLNVRPSFLCLACLVVCCCPFGISYLLLDTGRLYLHRACLLVSAWVVLLSQASAA